MSVKSTVKKVSVVISQTDIWIIRKIPGKFCYELDADRDAWMKQIQNMVEDESRKVMNILKEKGKLQIKRKLYRKEILKFFVISQTLSHG